jgi:hypothetical protein
MNELKKTGGYNLLIMVAYTALFSVLSTGKEWQLSFMILMAALISIQAGLNFIVSLIFFVQKDKARGRNFLLSSLIVLVIGFSTCFGVASL